MQPLLRNVFPCNDYLLSRLNDYDFVMQWKIHVLWPVTSSEKIQILSMQLPRWSLQRFVKFFGIYDVMTRHNEAMWPIIRFQISWRIWWATWNHSKTYPCREIAVPRTEGNFHHFHLDLQCPFVHSGSLLESTQSHQADYCYHNHVVFILDQKLSL